MSTRKNRLCASCLKFNFNKTIKSSINNKPRWLSKIDYVEEFINKYKKFSDNHPKKYTVKQEIHVGKNLVNRKILFWASKEDNNNIIPNDAKTAYGNFTNSGVATIDKNGNAEIKMLMPQNYKTIIKNEKKFKTFFRHFHYVISNRDKNMWLPNIYTKLLHNNFDFSGFKKKLQSNMYVVLNVLPCKYYAKDHINNTYNLPYTDIKKMDVKNLCTWIRDIVNIHYPKIKDLPNKNRLELYEVPIICYCAHNKCDASRIATEELMKKGFVNVNLYEDGMKGYKENTK